jgi:hypothetical protein
MESRPFRVVKPQGPGGRRNPRRSLAGAFVPGAGSKRPARPANALAGFCAPWRAPCGEIGARDLTPNKGKTLKLLVPVGQLNQRPAIRVFAGPINGGCFVRR